MSIQPFKVSVPATTANLGPGFDCLGLALDMRNELEVAPSDTPRIVVKGEGRGELPESPDNLVWKTYSGFFEEIGRETPPVKLACMNRIPLARGLGSSAAVRISALVAANRCAGGALDNDEILELASREEGHPDNVAPALLGGMVVCGRRNGKSLFKHFRPKTGIRAVLLIPAMRLETRRARQVLPEEIPFSDAVRNLQNTALTVTAFLTGDYENLGYAMKDRLHQPYREPLIPGFAAALEAAHREGAFGAALSGAGPTIVAFARDRLEEIGRAMKKAFADSGGGSSMVRITNFDLAGATVIPE